MSKWADSASSGVWDVDVLVANFAISTKYTESRAVMHDWPTFASVSSYKTMIDERPSQIADSQAILEAILSRTPARILTGNAGIGYPSSVQLQLRSDHAFALDSVHAELDLRRDLGPELIDRFRLFEVQTQADSKSRFLMRPDLGRVLAGAGRDAIKQSCPHGGDIQIVIGDGLSAAAIAAQVPPLLPLLEMEAKTRGRSFGRPFVVRYCRVGVMNDIGELLDPTVVLLLIGERPGLATAESLSAYLAYRPRPGHTDAQRNLISNIHARGMTPEEAAPRILALAEKMLRMQASGVPVKEDRAIGYSPGPARLPDRLPPSEGQE
jgi:ethanolamine ammonia-lyase small subunit